MFMSDNKNSCEMEDYRILPSAIITHLKSIISFNQFMHLYFTQAKWWITVKRVSFVIVSNINVMFKRCVIKLFNFISINDIKMLNNSEFMSYVIFVKLWKLFSLINRILVLWLPVLICWFYFALFLFTFTTFIT